MQQWRRVERRGTGPRRHPPRALGGAPAAVMVLALVLAGRGAAFFDLPSSAAQGTAATQAAPAAAPRPIRIVAYGDDESIGGRPLPIIGRMMPNPFLPKLIDHLWKQAEEIDLILHAGDFVRYDPPESYRDLLRRDDAGRLWEKFFPTSGGDEEYCQGRFAAFFELAEHLRALPHGRDACVGRDGRPRSGYYYYLERRIRGQRLVVVVLHNPDQYAAGERRSRCGAEAACDPLSRRNAQHRWLEETLRKARRKDAGSDRAFIILLSHRPLYSATYRRNLIQPLLRRYRVNLVIAGDQHLYARKLLDGTLHVISGLAGSLGTGGCHTDFVAGYDRCLPPAELGYVLGYNPPEHRYDHYLDLRISPDHFTLAPTRLDGGAIEGPLRLPR